MSKPVLNDYQAVLEKAQSLVLLAPGIFSKNGGMYSYLGLWLNEARKYSNNYKFFLDRKFENDFENPRIGYRKFSSERKSQMIMISILSLFLPAGIYKFFFKDYGEIITNGQFVHVITSFLLAYLLIRSLFLFHPDIAIIYTLHDPIPHQEKRSILGRFLKNYYLKKIYELSKRNQNFYLHFHSELLLDSVKDQAGNVIVLPHPLPEKRVTRREGRNEKITFGFMGRIEAYKGLDIMRNAFSLLMKEHSMEDKIALQIIGSGEIRHRNWEISGLEVIIDNRRVSEDEFHTYMANLDCVILPYIEATQSGVGYMALAYEIPIIATDTGGLKEIIEQSQDPRSSLIAPADAPALKNALYSFIVSENPPRS